MPVCICKLFKYIDTVYQLSLIVIHTQLKKQICYTNIFLDRKKLLVSENVKSSKNKLLTPYCLLQLFGQVKINQFS